MYRPMKYFENNVEIYLYIYDFTQNNTVKFFVEFYQINYVISSRNTLSTSFP